MSLFVTGTGTGVGKTVACAVILARYARRARLAYWKPVATGAAEERDSEFVRRAVGSAADVLLETYIFDPPVSPHLAARLARERIDPERILGDLVRHAAADGKRNLVIEGAGGLLVPLTDEGYLFADLAREMSLPVLVVASSGLGTINHTLLTLEAARSRRLEVAGVVLSGPPNAENSRAIERFGRAKVVAEVPRIPRMGRAGIARAAARFDREGSLKAFLVA